MINKILPLILLLVGGGAGVGAGIFLRPEPEPIEHAALKEGEDHQGEKHADEKEPSKDAEDEEDGPPTSEYVKMNNQFVIPVVDEENVVALVVVSLSVEVVVGQKNAVYEHEPKLRDSFLQVLFNHANRGGFDGAFTKPTKMKELRRALFEVAYRDIGEVAKDVLILEMARQDY